MSLLSGISNPFKNQSYAVITAVAIAACITVYLLVILPTQTANEDRRYMSVFEGIQRQLSGFIEDKLKEISNDQNIVYVGNVAQFRKGNPDYGFVLDTVIMDSVRVIKDTPSKLILYRKIPFQYGKSSGFVRDSVVVDLREFIRKISPMTNFTSFYFSDVSTPNTDPMLAVNTPLRDQDSLRINLRKMWPGDFGATTNRYYASQTNIANLKLFIAVGVAESNFQSAARALKPGLLLFSLMVIIILFLSINFIKPVWSSRQERVEQSDLIKVVFSVGALSAVLVVFLMVSGWGSAIKKYNYRDLKNLSEIVNYEFVEQFSAYSTDSVPWGKADFEQFALSDAPVDSISKGVLFFGRYGTYFDNYFRFDDSGYVQKDLSKEMMGLRRQYSDREYYKILNGRPEVTKVLRSVLSRANNEYQWIYVKRNGDKSISGFAFRDMLTDSIQIPPDTHYLLVDNLGDVLMQSDSNSSLYQNMLRGTNRSYDLHNVLLGRYTGQFFMEYQGTNYQVYGRKLEIESDRPIFILAMRNVTFSSTLSLFAFSNGFIIAILYGIFLLFLTMIYTSVLSAGRVKLFSKSHFYYLFPDASKTIEYKRLIGVNAAATVIVVLILLVFDAPAALVSCILIGLNLSLLNFLVLKVRYLSERYLYLSGILALCSLLCFLLLYNGMPLYATTLFVVFQTAVICFARKVRNTKADILPFIAAKLSINRRAYNSFTTIMMVNYFIVLPFIVVTSIYVSELNDYSTWHCSTAMSSKKPCVVAAYGCECSGFRTTDYEFGYEVLSKKADIGLFNRPGEYEMSKFTFDALKKGVYVNARNFFTMRNLIIFSAVMILLIMLVYSLSIYYSGRFFFDDLMQAARDRYFPLPGQKLTSHRYATEVLHDDPLQLIEPDLIGADPNPENRTINVQESVLLMEAHRVAPILQSDFVHHVNLRNLNSRYQDDWNSVPEGLHTALYDFAGDNFLNYKMKDDLMDLLDLGYIVPDEVTGRLMIRNPNLRKYILQQIKVDNHLAEYHAESQSGFFHKLRIPIIIVAVSLLLLLLYLNKDSYNRIIVFGGGITGTLALVNQLLALQKKT